jgi:hypothetical protein
MVAKEDVGDSKAATGVFHNVSKGLISGASPVGGIHFLQLIDIDQEYSVAGFFGRSGLDQLFQLLYLR